LNEVEDSVAVKEDMAVSAIVEEFLDVFAEPTGLPPSRSHDHAIILKQDAQPVSVRPYRYPYYQKEEIEKIVRELLESGVIQPSQSPFSSPVLLVRKADGSWRMCMDYRALNKETVKDKFPIPVIDELLDELNCSRIILSWIYARDTIRFWLSRRMFLKLPLGPTKVTTSSL
jgi:hypothetical protein